jgi:hypothetical protein
MQTSSKRSEMGQAVNRLTEQPEVIRLLYRRVMD